MTPVPAVCEGGVLAGVVGVRQPQRRAMAVRGHGPKTDRSRPRQGDATVAFAGHRRGLVCIHSSVDAARNIAGAMLGMAEDEITSEIPDAMGEVANMVAGTFRNKLAAIEPASAIAVPTVTIGSDFSTKYLSAVRRARCPFEMEGQPISVELILTGEEAA